MAALSQENQLRNVFNKEIITSFAKNIKKNHPDFDEKKFLNSILPHLDPLSFKERSSLIKDSLIKYLPPEFPQAIDILLKSLRAEAKELGGWHDFIIHPQTSFVSLRGKDHFELSMKALYEMTKRFTAEFDLRAFIEKDYEKSMKFLHKWVDDKSEHVRRLVSEGTRSRLPWASRIKRFQEDPSPVIELLEKLKHDASLYVRRSVANNINDIAKDNPEIAIALLKKWNKISDAKVNWIVKHAARSLIKQGHPEVILMLGCDTNPKINVSEITISPKKQAIGKDIEFSFEIKSNSNEEQKLIVDFVVHFKKANGKSSPKVFKLRNLSLSAKAKIGFTKKLSLKNLTTRKMYKGEHIIEIQINGGSYSKSSFVLV